MTRKEIFAIGMLAAFAFASVMAVTPAAAQNTNDFSDNDDVSQPNTANPTQSSDNTARTDGAGDDTATATSSDTADASQSNSYTDDDSQSVTQTDNDLPPP
jgi:cytoskeletal protein RodZ